MARLFKTTARSSPSSRMTSSTAIWWGSQVATITRPTEIGLTPRSASREANSGGGGSASRRTASV